MTDTTAQPAPANVHAASPPVDPAQRITFAFHLRENPNVQPKLDELAAQPLNQRAYLSDANFDPARTSGADYFGALPADVKTVTDWVAQVNAGISDPTQQLTVVSTEYDIHAVKVSGPAGTVSKLFGIDLDQWKQDSANLTGGHLADAIVPGALAGAVVGVVGFSTTGPFSPKYVRLSDAGQRPDHEGRSLGGRELRRTKVVRAVRNVAARVIRRGAPAPAPALPGKPLYADQIADFYNLPDLRGRAQAAVPRIAIFEYGGRSSQANLDRMAQMRTIDPTLVPRIARLYVDGIAQNFDADANVECDLDAQQIALMLACRGIHHQLIEVNALDTEMAAGDAIAWAARDPSHPLGGGGCDLGSESWGDPKWNWLPQAIAYRESANKFALLKGMVVFVAAGDNGSRDTTPNITVDYYSGSPWNVGVGGTHIWVDSKGVKHAIGWGGPQMHGATGGGVDPSQPVPYYQAGAGITPLTPSGQAGCGAVDMAADASPNTGLIVMTGDSQDGSTPASPEPIGGTSQATPIAAAIAAAAIAVGGRRLGPFQSLLYGIYRDQQAGHGTVLRDITEGTNGDYNAAPGWDAISGVGEIADAAGFAAAVQTVQPVAPQHHVAPRHHPGQGLGLAG